VKGLAVSSHHKQDPPKDKSTEARPGVKLVLNVCESSTYLVAKIYELHCKVVSVHGK